MQLQEVSSASAAELAKVSRAADKALALLLPDKGPMEISPRLTGVIVLEKLNNGSSNESET